MTYAADHSPQGRPPNFPEPSMIYVSDGSQPTQGRILAPISQPAPEAEPQLPLENPHTQTRGARIQPLQRRPSQPRFATHDRSPGSASYLLGRILRGPADGQSQGMQSAIANPRGQDLPLREAKYDRNGEHPRPFDHQRPTTRRQPSIAAESQHPQEARTKTRFQDSLVSPSAISTPQHSRGCLDIKNQRIRSLRLVVRTLPGLDLSRKVVVVVAVFECHLDLMPKCDSLLWLGGDLFRMFQ
jgi:hypothetical protein